MTGWRGEEEKDSRPDAFFVFDVTLWVGVEGPNSEDVFKVFCFATLEPIARTSDACDFVIVPGLGSLACGCHPMCLSLSMQNPERNSNRDLALELPL